MNLVDFLSMSSQQLFDEVLEHPRQVSELLDCETPKESMERITELCEKITLKLKNLEEI